MWGEADPLIPFKALSKKESKFIATEMNSGVQKALSGDSNMDRWPRATLQSLSITAARPKIAPSRV